ncbi:MAG: hypothetical protein EOO21_02240 [Comamonadaceae bacterium]|nr:MAG: hypothetical protein EOO21_02240 [Comamonadaceae bacterium]
MNVMDAAFNVAEDYRGGARALSALSREFGELCSEACTALADSRVSDNEMKRLEREGGELTQRLQTVLAAFRARNIAGKAE